MAGEIARDVRIDVLRFVALVSMFVAHCIPPSPLSPIAWYSNHLTVALFATLVGIGTQLSWDRRRSTAGFFAAAAIRGGVLLALGVYIDDWGAQIYVVLAFLGLLTWVCALLVAAPSAALAIFAVAMLFIAPRVQDTLTPEHVQQAQAGHATRAWTLELLATGPAYRLVGLVIWGAVGMLLVRHVIRPRRNRQTVVRGTAIVAVPLLILIVADKATGLAVEPYDGRTLSLAFNTLLVLAVAGAVFVFAPRWDPRLQKALAAAGSMTLTIYVLHTAWLAYYVREVAPGRTDNTWPNVIGLTLAAVLLAVLWRFVVRPKPWHRGPLEGPVDLAVGAASRALSGR